MAPLARERLGRLQRRDQDRPTTGRLNVFADRLAFFLVTDGFGALPVSTGICFRRSTNHRPAGPGGDLVCHTADIGRTKPSGGTSSIGSTERRPSSKSLRTACNGIPPQPRPLSKK